MPTILHLAYNKAILLEIADLRPRDAWPFCGDDAIPVFLSSRIGILNVFTTVFW